MRNILMLIAVICCLSASGQEVITLYNTSHKLNGGARSQVGGISRLVIPVTVPYKCNRIVYNISTSKGEGVNPVALTAQLATLTDKAGFLSTISGIVNISDMIMPSQQTGLLSIYLYLLQRCAYLFESKATQQCNAFGYQPNITGGTYALACNMNDWGKTFYIGIMNPQTWESTYFNVEVSAILEKTETEPEPEKPADNIEVKTEENSNNYRPSIYFRKVQPAKIDGRIMRE